MAAKLTLSLSVSSSTQLSNLTWSTVQCRPTCSLKPRLPLKARRSRTTQLIGICQQYTTSSNLKNSSNQSPSSKTMKTVATKSTNFKSSKRPKFRSYPKSSVSIMLRCLNTRRSTATKHQNVFTSFMCSDSTLFKL